MQAGEMTMLDEKGRRKVYTQEYNYQKDLANNTLISTQKPVVQNLLREEENKAFDS